MSEWTDKKWANIAWMEEKLMKLKNMFEKWLINEEEFNKKKTEILDKM
jgi:hypothetical protein